MKLQSDILTQPLFSLAGSKLGRCAACMRLSFGLALGFILLFAGLLAMQAPHGVLVLSALPAAAFGAWSMAHGLAYLLREPQRAAGCSSCAERARKARWQRRLAWLRGDRIVGTSAPRASGCGGCGKKTPVEAMGDAPAAEAGLRHVVEQSPQFRSLLPRLASAEPADTWTADMLHYFLYDLQADADGLASHALFIARWEEDTPVSAVIVTPDPAGGAPRSVDLLRGTPTPSR